MAVHKVHHNDTEVTLKVVGLSVLSECHLYNADDAIEGPASPIASLYKQWPHTHQVAELCRTHRVIPY